MAKANAKANELTPSLIIDHKFIEERKKVELKKQTNIISNIIHAAKNSYSYKQNTIIDQKFFNFSDTKVFQIKHLVAPTPHESPATPPTPHESPEKPN